MKRILPVLILTLPLATAANAPELKEGLWQIHMQTSDSPGDKKSDNTVSLCRNHAYDKAVEARAKAIPGCTTVSENLSGNRLTVEMRCVTGPTTIDTKSTTTWQGDTAAHAESSSTYTPPFNGVAATTMIQDQTFQGACPAGAKPGDRFDANGNPIRRPGR